jgi:hypothetical protein
MPRISGGAAVIHGPQLLAQLVFTPLHTSWSIWVGIGISARTNDVRTAQQLSALAGLPAIAVTSLIASKVHDVDEAPVLDACQRYCERRRRSPGQQIDPLRRKQGHHHRPEATEVNIRMVLDSHDAVLAEQQLRHQIGWDADTADMVGRSVAGLNVPHLGWWSM